MRRLPRPRLLLALALLLPLALPDAAAAFPEAGPRAAAMGDAFRGVATSNDALFLNPGGLALYPRYSVEGFWSRDGRSDGNRFTISVVDSKSGPVAGGVAYTYEDFDADTGRQGSRLRMGAGFAAARWLLVGFSAQYLGLETGEEEVRQVTGDAGLVLRPVHFLTIGVTGENLFNPVEEGDVAPRAYGAGVGLSILGNLLVSFDWVRRFDLPDEPDRWGVGAEWFTLGFLALRGGWSVDELTGERRWTAGLGYVDPVLGLDVTYGNTVEPDGEGQYLLAGFRLFL